MGQIPDFSDFVTGFLPSLIYSAMALGFIWTLSVSDNEERIDDKTNDLQNH